MNTEAPQYAFFKAGRNLSVRCGFKPKPKSKPNPGPGPPASRWSAPGPGKRTRREDHALLIVRDEFRTGYSLIGLLASRARLRFTGIVRISSGQRPANELSSNGECVFPPCLTEGVHPSGVRQNELSWALYRTKTTIIFLVAFVLGAVFGAAVTLSFCWPAWLYRRKSR